MSVVDRVNKAWDRIDAWYAKNTPDWTLPKGATDEEIDALAKHLNVVFPEEFRVSLKRHNGIKEGQWPMTCLHSIKQIQSSWDSWKEQDQEGELEHEDVETDGTFQQKFWCESWIEIDSDKMAAGGVVMDLAPGPKGHVGQILFFDHVEGPSGPAYSDYAAYLEDMANKLEKGECEVTDDCLAWLGGSAKGEGDKDEDEDEDEDEEGEEYEDEIEEDEDDEEEKTNKSKKKVKK